MFYLKSSVLEKLDGNVISLSRTWEWRAFTAKQSTIQFPNIGKVN